MTSSPDSMIVAEPVTAPELVIIGDDLSGSAESAAVFHRNGYAVRIGLRSLPDAGAIRVVDTDTRQLTPEQARARAAAVIKDLAAGRVVLKLDSLLRGRLVPHLAALEPARYPVVFTPALPVQDRIVADGIGYDRGRVIGGRPLRELIAPLPAESIPALADVADLADRLGAATARGKIAICDATDEADLDRIVEAASRLPGVRFAGAAGLIAALARRLPPGPAVPRSPTSTGPVLCVLGTAAPSARRQVHELTAADSRIRVLTRPPAGWAAGTAAELRDQLATGRSAVIRLPTPGSAAGLLEGDPGPVTGRADPVVGDHLAGSDDPRLVAELAELTVRVAGESTVPLVLSGGQTARAVLDRLGVITLEVTAEIQHGAVALRCDDGRTVVTRPGSFGAADSLVRILAHLTHAAPLSGRPVPS